jgi:hypothetical protein
MERIADPQVAADRLLDAWLDATGRPPGARTVDFGAR